MAQANSNNYANLYGYAQLKASNLTLKKKVDEDKVNVGLELTVQDENFNGRKVFQNVMIENTEFVSKSGKAQYTDECGNFGWATSKEEFIAAKQGYGTKVNVKTVRGAFVGEEKLDKLYRLVNFKTLGLTLQDMKSLFSGKSFVFVGDKETELKDLFVGSKPKVLGVLLGIGFYTTKEGEKKDQTMIYSYTGKLDKIKGYLTAVKSGSEDTDGEPVLKSPFLYYDSQLAADVKCLLPDDEDFTLQEFKGIEADVVEDVIAEDLPF